MDVRSQVKQKFIEQFKVEPILVRSPGRINLIGEHVDYNDGIVLPAAIDKYIYLAISKRDDPDIVIYSIDYDDFYQGSVLSVERSQKMWANYILGVVDQIQKRGNVIGGFNLCFSGDIPQGAGLSSSAALECATAFALKELFNLPFSRKNVVSIAKAAENEFVGVNCGVMDQFSSIFGKEGTFIRLDCQTLHYSYMPLADQEISFVLFDSKVKHSLASSAYNERRQDCERGLLLIRKAYPSVETFRDVTRDMVVDCLQHFDNNVFKRCLYVVEEIERTNAACNDLVNMDFELLGRRLFETHYGLRDLYEVSCPELDLLVSIAEEEPSILGARVMGGGFGGCTINLVRTNNLSHLVAKVQEKYWEKTGVRIPAYGVKIANGTELLEVDVNSISS